MPINASLKQQILNSIPNRAKFEAMSIEAKTTTFNLLLADFNRTVWEPLTNPHTEEDMVFGCQVKSVLVEMAKAITAIKPHKNATQFLNAYLNSLGETMFPLQWSLA